MLCFVIVCKTPAVSHASYQAGISLLFSSFFFYQHLIVGLSVAVYGRVEHNNCQVYATLFSTIAVAAGHSRGPRVRNFCSIFAVISSVYIHIISVIDALLSVISFLYDSFHIYMISLIDTRTFYSYFVHLLFFLSY